MKKRLKTEAIQMKGGERTMKKYDKAGNRSHFPTFSLSSIRRFAVSHFLTCSLSHFLTFSVLAALCLAGASGAWALGISLDTVPSTAPAPMSWTLENISPGTTHTSATTWKVTNNGGEAEDISINAAGETSGWTAVDEITDDNQFILKHNARVDYKSVAGGVSLADNLPDAGEETFNLKFTAPRLGSDATEDIKVTLSAHLQWYSGPVLSDIDTHYGRKGITQEVTITGSGFESPARVRLNKTGETSIVDESPTYTTGTSLTADFAIPADVNEGIYTIEVENVDTGDRSPAKTASDAVPYPDVDCFFGVAASDANEWTTDPAKILNGVKVGSSDLTTLVGTFGPGTCQPASGAISYSSCVGHYDFVAERGYVYYSEPKYGTRYLHQNYSSNWCQCLHPGGSARANSGKQDNIDVWSWGTCETAGTSSYNNYGILWVECFE